MKHAVLALGLILAPFAASSAAAQQGGHIVQRPQAAKPAMKPGKAAPQTSIQPAQPFQPPAGQPAMQERSGAFGAMKQDESAQRQGAFNTQMKPLGGPGYIPGQR